MGDPVQNKKRVSRNCLYLSFIGILIILLGISLAYVEWNPKDKDAQIQENNDLKDLTTQNEILMNEIETLTTENYSLKEDKKNLTTQNKRLMKEKETLTTEKETLKEDTNNLTTKNKTLMKENETFKTEKEHFETAKEIFKTEKKF